MGTGRYPKMNGHTHRPCKKVVCQPMKSTELQLNFILCHCSVSYVNEAGGLPRWCLPRWAVLEPASLPKALSDCHWYIYIYIYICKCIIDTTHHGTHHCAQKTEGITNHSSDSKLINTLLNPTFTERFPVLGKINDHFNTFFFFGFVFIFK